MTNLWMLEYSKDFCVIECHLYVAFSLGQQHCYYSHGWSLQNEIILLHPAVNGLFAAGITLHIWLHAS